MDATADRPEFEPPQHDPMWRGLGWALLAHALLFVGLTQGLRWQRESPDVGVEAELWARVPQQAAPREVVPPPPPPAPAPTPAPPPAPVVKAPPAPAPQVNRDAQIALEREKQKRELEKQKHELEKEKQAELDHQR